MTREKVRRTIINVLSLIQSYPELTFLVSNMAYLRCSVRIRICGLGLRRQLSW